MSARRLSRYNTLVVDYLMSRLDRAQQANFSECRLFDSDGSKYLLQREQNTPDKIRLSFALAAFNDNKAVANTMDNIAAALSTRYHGHCKVCSDTDGAYQLILTLQLDSLQSLDSTQQLNYLQDVGSIRAGTLCWPLRQVISLASIQACDSRLSAVVFAKLKCYVHMLRTSSCYLQTGTAKSQSRRDSSTCSCGDL